MKNGGTAKGELVLAIYELANCYQHGWGVDKDSGAAKLYYETAAQLGDVDAMCEAARCYEMGIGTGKDKVSSYYSSCSFIHTVSLVDFSIKRVGHVYLRVWHHTVSNSDSHDCHIELEGGVDPSARVYPYFFPLLTSYHSLLMCIWMRWWDAKVPNKKAR